MLHNGMHLRRSAIAGVQCTVAVLDTTEASQQSEAAANEDECQALRDDSRSLSKSLEHKSLGTLRRRGTTSWSMEEDSESSGWIRSQVGLHVTPESVVQQVVPSICKFTAHARPTNMEQQPKNVVSTTSQRQLREWLRRSQVTLEHSMHPTDKIHPCLALPTSSAPVCMCSYSSSQAWKQFPQRAPLTLSPTLPSVRMAGDCHLAKHTPSLQLQGRST